MKGKLSPHLRMLRKILRFRTLERVGIAAVFIIYGSYWFIAEPVEVPTNFPPTLAPTPDGRATETIIKITAVPTEPENAKPQGPLVEVSLGKRVSMTEKPKKKLPSKFKHSPLNWIDGVPVSDGKVDNVTIVTAYINLGRYAGKGNIKYSPELYHQWMSIFGKMENPVITFMNDKNDAALFNKIRKEVPSAESKVELVNKQSLWGFDLGPDIENVLARPEYKKNVKKPAAYLSVLHSKYDFMATALKYNYFKTKYYCWMDMDLFKDLLDTTKESFVLRVPDNFDENKIAYSEESPKGNWSITEIFRENMSWISGSAFLGRASVMKSLIKQYVTYTEMYLNRTYVNTDAQVLYAMYQYKKKLQVFIQPYPMSDKYKHGEQLGYLMKEAGEKRKKKT